MNAVQLESFFLGFAAGCFVCALIITAFFAGSGAF
jgi:hypothetical protein